MNYKIEEHSSEIIVYKNDTKILNVLRKYSWAGSLNSYFYTENHLILHSVYCNLIFKSKIKIVLKDDSLDFTLHKSNKGIGLIHDASFLHVKNPILKGGESVLYNNDDIVGYITPNKFSIGTSFDYSIKFNNDELDNYYLVLLFIMRLYSLEN